MADEEEVIYLDEILEKVLYFCLDEAQTKKLQNEDHEFCPFTVVVEGENMYIEEIPVPDGDSESAKQNAYDQIKTASSFASHYFLCYDGYFETEDENGETIVLDTILCECGEQDADQGMVFGLFYKQDGDDILFEEAPVFIQYDPLVFVKKDTSEEDEFAQAQEQL